MAPRAGLLLRRGVELLFLPASIARQVVPSPRLSCMPWDKAQMALVGGEVVAVVELGEPSGHLVLCEISGQWVALSGLCAERAGFFAESGSGVHVDGAHVPMLDLDAALAQFQNHPTKHEERRA